MAANKVWMEWRRAFFCKFACNATLAVCLYSLSALLVLLSGLGYGRRRVAIKRIESGKVADLVESSLDLLRQQETLHHVDPVSYRAPYLGSLHLRDLVLREEHSVKARQQLWSKVEAVVENNANVKVQTEEVEGDEIKVWRWVGAATPATSPRKSLA